MDNLRIMEYFVVAVLIGLGVPIAALLGARAGEKEAALAYLHATTNPGASLEQDFKQVVLASQEGIDKGRELFQRNCAACHGAAADGKGAAASALSPAPRDFLDPKAKWTRGREPLDIFASLTEGNPGTAMPGFTASLSVADRWALVHYLGSLPGVKDQYHPMDDVAAAKWRP